MIVKLQYDGYERLIDDVREVLIGKVPLGMSHASNEVINIPDCPAEPHKRLALIKAYEQQCFTTNGDVWIMNNFGKTVERL